MVDRIKNYLQISFTELRHLVSVHRLALIIFPLLAAVFLHDVLFSNKGLAAFDVLLAQPSFNTEFDYKGVHQPVLNDSPFAHYPERKLNWELFKQGHNFDFSPYIFSGSSYTGRKTGAFITSFPQLFFDTPGAMDWSIWLRMTLAGFFMYLFLASMGVNRFGAILAGILWTYNLHQIVWLEFPQHLATQLWMPLLLLLNIQLIKCRSTFPPNLIIGLILVNLLFYTSGYTQIVLYYYFFIGLFNTLYIGFDQSRSVRERVTKWIVVNGIYILAVSILVADVLSELNDLKLGLRGTQGFRERHTELKLAFSTVYELFKNFTPDINELKRFFSPDYLGGIWNKSYDKQLSGNIVEGGVYYGVLGLFLSFYSITGHRLLKDKRLYYVLLFLFFFFIGFFYSDPVVMSIYNLIPFGGSGSYSRILTILIFLLCIFAAYGLSHLIHDLVEKKYLKVAVALVIFCTLPIIARIFDSDFSLDKFRYSYVILAVTTCLIIVAVLSKRKRFIAYAVILVAVVDLFSVTYDFNTRMRNSRIFPENKTIQYLLSDPDIFRVAVLANSPMYHPNILSYYSLPTIGGYLTVASTDYLNFIKNSYGEARITLNGILYLFKGGNLDFLRQMNVKYIISDEKMDTDKADLVNFDNNSYIYRMLDHLPRVYCASDYIKISSAKNIIAELTKSLERFDRPVLGSDLPLSSGQLPADCTIDALSVSINKLEFQVNTSDKSIVLIPYNYNDFWHATVKGEPAKIYRVNSRLMAVDVPAGNSEVEFLYQNNYEVTASTIKIVFALLAIVVILIWSNPGILSLALVLALSVMVWKNSYTLPGIKNNDIPERTVRQDIVAPENLQMRKNEN
ncbi:MAG: YfhO family protein [Pseudomonadota bacterium]|nr:YfhO family protein [Pseudomonadota bacterium]